MNSDEYKARVKRALFEHHKRIHKKNNPKRRNKSPEKDEVQKPCMSWMRASGWDVEVYEAKATFDPRRGVWRNQAMRAGVCDCQGITPKGEPVYIEFKARGRLKTFWLLKNFNQQEFLISKINFGAFGVVVDSSDLLQRLYTKWSELRAADPKASIQFLIDSLPPKGRRGRG